MGDAVGNVGSALGLGDMQGSYYKPNNSNPALDMMMKRNTVMGDRPVQQNLLDYATGKTGLNDTLQAGFNQDSNGYQGQAFRNLVATDPLTGSKLATDQVQNSPVLGQLFGNNGALSSALGKEQQLQNQGFQLKPEDIEAYGQTSGNIARLFGQQEQGLSQSLADRGLAGAGSGAAGAGFSGLMGNKNEQLAKSQMDIANARMQNTMQRIGQQQQYAAQLGSQANTAINGQYDRNLAGVNAQDKQLSDTANANNQYMGLANSADQASAKNQQGREKQSLFGAAAQGANAGMNGSLASGVADKMSGAMKGGG